MAVLVVAAGCGGQSSGSTAASPASTLPVPTMLPPTSPPTTLPGTSPAAGESGSATTRAPLAGLAYEAVAPAGFPIMLTARPGDEVALLAERGGVVFDFRDGVVGEVIGDISEMTIAEGERGLLGMARHPEDDSRLFIHYSDIGGDTTLSEFTFNGAFDVSSERILLEVDQPAANHNGGMIQFGPDGALYLGLGDGGGSGDRFGHGQNTETLLGGIVRIDVDSAEASLWQYGLRNPWRFWIDADDLWIGDVGQGSFEEIDLAPVTAEGLNYGWSITEGAHCFNSETCDTDGLTMPLLEVARGDSGTCSITGGVVYRGSAIPELDGRFLFSDYCGGYLRSVDKEGAVVDHTGDVGIAGSVVSFGVDGAGEVYVLTTDQILKLVPLR